MSKKLTPEERKKQVEVMKQVKDDLNKSRMAKAKKVADKLKKQAKEL